MTDQFEGTVETVPDLSGHALDLLRSGDGPTLTINRDDLVPVDLTAMTLDELGDIAAREAALADDESRVALSHLTMGLMHAIRAGEVLLEAQRRVDPGAWTEWVEARMPGRSSATWTSYMRFATHKQALLGADRPLATYNAHDYLKDAGAARRLSPYHHQILETSDERRREAVRLKAAGVSQAEVANLLGVSPSAVSMLLLDPDERKRRVRAANKRKRDRDRDRREQERRAERDALAKSVGGDLSRAYQLTRQLSALLDKCLGDDQFNREQRDAIREATRGVLRVETGVDKALRLGRTDV